MSLESEHKKYNNDHFRRFASKYDIIELFMSGMRKKIASNIFRKKKILDVACGTGSLSVALAKLGHDVTGVDLSEDMLDIARRKIQGSMKLRFISADATKLDFKTSSIDVSTISLGLHEMPRKLASDVLKEIRRVTKKDGTIIVVDYNVRKDIFSRIFLHISKLWESKYFWDYVEDGGVETYLKDEGLAINNKRTFLLGTIQVLEMTNEK